MENSSANGSTRSVPIIRATPTQTAVLMQEFMISDVPTKEKLKELSSQTNLPYKWIHNWFTRQRKKANKSNTKPKKTYTGLYPPLSPQESTRDAGGMSTTSSMAGLSEYTIISASSSGTLETSVSSEPPRRRRGRPPSKKASPARALRSSKRQGLASANEATHVKAELIESSGSLYTETNARPASCGLNTGGNVSTMATMPYSQLIPGVAPPKRSPMASTINTGRSRTRNGRSNLSVNQPESMYARLPPDFSSENDQNKTRYARTPRTQKVPSGPVFHTQFHNNVPENFSSARVLPAVSSNSYSMHDFLPGSVSESSRSRGTATRAQPSGSAFYDEVMPLAPAFDWEQNVPSVNDSLVSNNFYASEPTQYFANLAYQNYNQSFNFQNIIPGSSPQTGLETSYSNAEISDAMLLDSLKEAINPSLAPLKYLTDILHAFEDEQGTYVRLLAYDQGDNIKKCLLDENLVPKNSFQATMALALLTKLGFEWDY